MTVKKQTTFSVSVIVPTRNRHEGLKDCLESIISSYGPYKELIVVDSSDEPIQKKNEELAKELGVKYHYEKRRRLAVARNTGIRISSEDIVVFADDDFIVDQDWISKLIKNFKDPEVVCCTGRMLPYRQDALSQLYERYASFDKGNKRRVFTKKDLNIFELLRALVSNPYVSGRSLGDKYPPPGAIGCGFCSFKKQIFQETGYFDENLGKGPLSTSEDTDMYYRILKRTDYKIVYEPTAIIYHNHPQTTEKLLKAAYGNGIIRPAFYLKYLKDMYILVLFFGSFFLSILALITALLRRDHEFRRVIVADLKGFFAGFGRHD